MSMTMQEISTSTWKITKMASYAVSVEFLRDQC